jgi:hypothetical protein
MAFRLQDVRCFRLNQARIVRRGLAIGTAERD